MRGRKPKFRHVRGRDTAFQSLLGHNGGPPLPSPASWNAFCWRKATAKSRRAPSREVLAIRLRRAAELGLDYPTYAAVLAHAGATPRTLIVVLSRAVIAYGAFGPRIAAEGSLALREEVAEKLAGLSRPEIVLVAPAPTGGPARGAVADALATTVRSAGWRTAACGILPAGGGRETAEALAALLADAGLPPGTALLIADPDAHQETVTRARLAGLLSPQRYFALPPTPPTPSTP
ncbi:hypothetical protein [Thalassobaculum salexigens]|uniref:hypothetical protein n=1 Tax=Thalassobaculum salexigens TaxID=455360 RepID=UPI00248ECD82|nr:hypothetical protein [Thalassobaculum salexigens]